MGNDIKRFAPISSARRIDIAELAEEVANEYGSSGRIDFHSILRDKKITWSYGDYDDAFDGMLEHEDGMFHIYCNLNRVGTETSPRARFTIGHELGHFYIDEHRNELAAGRTLRHGSRCEYESKNPVEQEADHFASNLLMPTKRFIQTANGYSVGLQAILGLARSFSASVTSSAIRYATLGIKPCVVVKWGNDGYQWRWLSDEARLGRYLKTIDSIDQIPHDSPTGRALAGEQPPDVGFFEAGTTALFWFPYISAGSYKDIILIEQAMPLGRFGVLTFIYPLDGRFPHFE
jgi:Zn-dependent peptidase ImmA (M78 family)